MISFYRLIKSLRIFHVHAFCMQQQRHYRATLYNNFGRQKNKQKLSNTKKIKYAKKNKQTNNQTIVSVLMRLYDILSKHNIDLNDIVF